MSWLDALRPTFPMIQRNYSFLKHSQRVGNNQKYDFPVSKKKITLRYPQLGKAS